MSRIGFALTLIAWGASLLAGAMLIAILDSPVTQLLSAGREHTSGESAASGLAWVETAWEATPFVIILLGLIMLVAAAAARGGR